MEGIINSLIVNTPQNPSICRSRHVYTFPNNELIKSRTSFSVQHVRWMFPRTLRAALDSPHTVCSNSLNPSAGNAHCRPAADSPSPRRKKQPGNTPPACTRTLCSLCVEINVGRNYGRDTPMICNAFTLRLKEHQHLLPALLPPSLPTMT